MERCPLSCIWHIPDPVCSFSISCPLFGPHKTVDQLVPDKHQWTTGCWVHLALSECELVAQSQALVTVWFLDHSTVWQLDVCVLADFAHRESPVAAAVHRLLVNVYECTTVHSYTFTFTFTRTSVLGPGCWQHPQSGVLPFKYCKPVVYGGVH